MNINSLYRRSLIATTSLFLLAASLRGDDWMTWPSTYTHDVNSVRVDQYATAVQPVGPDRSSYQRSGYRNTRSTIQAGQSADNYHVVEQYGQQIVPYEQWRFPFRPYGVPYDAWGPQLPMVYGHGLGGYYGGVYPPVTGSPTQPLPVPSYPPNYSGGIPIQPNYQNQPWFDGNYPEAPPLDNRTDEQFFWTPPR